MAHSTARRGVVLISFLAATITVGLVGSLVTQPAIEGWYAELNKPDWTPPNWLFGPVWTLLYLMMAVAAWRIWDTRDPRRVRALSLWGTQLVLNGLWSPAFFGVQVLSLALVVIVLLALTIALTIRAFQRIDRLAAWLLVPYLAWVLYAAALNAAILGLN